MHTNVYAVYACGCSLSVTCQVTLVRYTRLSNSESWCVSRNPRPTCIGEHKRSFLYRLFLQVYVVLYLLVEGSSNGFVPWLPVPITKMSTLHQNMDPMGELGAWYLAPVAQWEIISVT